jgi:nicotinamidase-related amidase
MMKKPDNLRYGRLENCVHICVDMQRMFAEETAWKTPWMKRVLPNVLALIPAHAAETIFTRFMPPMSPGEAAGTWKLYYEKWSGMTLSQLGVDLADLMPELAHFVPPAKVIDKQVYSPWHDSHLASTLQQRMVNTVVVSGGETDVCVLATVLGAVDRGYRVVIAKDALCSSSDETHDALMKLYESRYSEQIEAVTVETILANW